MNASPWAELDAIMEAQAEPEGPEWFTVEQYASRYGLTNDAASGRLIRMEKAGKLEVWRGVINRRITRKYRLKNTPLSASTPVDVKQPM